jgi:hypothetical protein
MQIGQVGRSRGKPPEVDLEAVFSSVRLQPDRQVRLGFRPMIRRIDETLTGLGNQQEFLAGLRALVRTVRAEPS